MAKLGILLVGSLLLSTALSASFAGGELSPVNETFTIRTVLKSPVNGNLIISGLNPQSGPEVSLTTWTPEDEEFSPNFTFAISQKGYINCQPAIGGFLTDPSIDSNINSDYYFVWACIPEDQLSTYHYFFARMDGDGTVKNQSIFKPKTNTGSASLEVAFMQNNLVVLVTAGDQDILLGLSDSFVFQFQVVVPQGLEIFSLQPIPDSDNFAFLASGSSVDQFYVAIFNSDGSKQKENSFKMAGVKATSRGMAISSSRILVLTTAPDAIYSTVIDLSDLTVYMTAQRKNLGGVYYPLAGKTSLGIALGGNYEVLAGYLFDADFNLEYSFAAGSVARSFIAYVGAATLLDEKYIAFAGAIWKKAMRFGALVFNFEGDNSSFTTPSPFLAGIKTFEARAELKWDVVTELTGGVLETTTEPFAKVVDSAFDRIPGDTKVSSSAFFLPQLD